MLNGDVLAGRGAVVDESTAATGAVVAAAGRVG